MPELSIKNLEHIVCNYCEQNNTHLLYTIPVREDQIGVFAQDEWNIVQCKNCQLIYANPRPDAVALEYYYSFSNEFDQQFVQDWFIESARLQLPTWQRYLKTLQHFLSKGRLLDVGCGAGTFLIEAQNAGFDAIGQEVAPFFIKHAREIHNLEIYDEEIEALPFPINSFDCVTAFDVIEHHPDPKLLLKEMYSLLKPNGIAVIGTHDIGNIYARLYGRKWRHLNPVGHLTYFDKKTLAKMAEDSGFQILYVGGMHTLDINRIKELRNYLIQFGRVILFRALILGVYKPLTNLIPQLKNWNLLLNGNELNHKHLMVRVGGQIIMNDNMIFYLRKNA